MEKRTPIETHTEYINEAFEDAFKKRILNGRTKLTADIHPRAYTYSDLMKMYSSGVMVGIRIVEKELDK